MCCCKVVVGHRVVLSHQKIPGYVCSLFLVAEKKTHFAHYFCFILTFHFGIWMLDLFYLQMHSQFGKHTFELHPG